MLPQLSRRMASDFPLRGERNHGLQALRGIAALLVYLQHAIAYANISAPGPVDILYIFDFGGIGVYIFFVLSGYLMATKVKDPPLKFAMDRMRRIYPTFWISVLVAGSLVWAMYGVFGATWPLLLLMPFGEKPQMSLPYWTLYYEMAFYAFIFFLMIVAKRWVIPLALALLAASYWFWRRPYTVDMQFPDLSQLFLTIYAVFFFAGILVYVLNLQSFNIPAVYFAISIGFITISTFFYYLPGIHFLPVWLQVDGFYLTKAFGGFFAVCAALVWVPSGLFGRFLHWIGNLSYGVYLAHLVAIQAVVYVLLQLGSPVGFWPALLFCLIGAAPLSIGMGLLDLRVQGYLKARLKWRGARGPVQVGA